MENMLAGKTVLVSGGTGSIGSEIVRQVLEDGAKKVIVFSRDEIKHFMLKQRISDERLETVVGDTRNLNSIKRVFDRFDIDIIFHAAAMKHVVICEDFPMEAVETNIIGTQNLVNLALNNGVSRMITISTDKAAYPTSVMGATKFIAERITLRANRISKNKQIFSCVRFGNVAGSRGSVIPVYIDNLFYRKPIQVTDPEVTRFIIEIPDAVKLVIKATEYALGGEVFILKMRAFKLGDLVYVILDRIAPRLNITRDNVVIKVTGLVPGEKLHEDLISDSECARLYELNDMYILLPDNDYQAKYPGLSKVKTLKYCSMNVDLVSPGKLEEIVLKHLENCSMINTGGEVISNAV